MTQEVKKEINNRDKKSITTEEESETAREGEKRENKNIQQLQIKSVQRYIPSS